MASDVLQCLVVLIATLCFSDHVVQFEEVKVEVPHDGHEAAKDDNN